MANSKAEKSTVCSRWTGVGKSVAEYSIFDDGTGKDVHAGGFVDGDNGRQDDQEDDRSSEEDQQDAEDGFDMGSKERCPIERPEAEEEAMEDDTDNVQNDVEDDAGLEDSAAVEADAEHDTREADAEHDAAVRAEAQECQLKEANAVKDMINRHEKGTGKSKEAPRDNGKQLVPITSFECGDPKWLKQRMATFDTRTKRKREEDESGTDSDVGISKGEAWKLREAKGKSKGKKNKDSKQVEEVEGDAAEDPKNQKPTGKILKWREDKKFGFIQPDGTDHNQIFFHFSALKCSRKEVAKRFLDVHATAKLDVRYTAKEQNGKFAATSVKIIDARWKTALAAEWESPGWLTTGQGSWEGNVADSDAHVQQPSAPAAAEPTSVPEWNAAQDRLFGHLKQLPPNWIRISSKSKGTVYFYNVKTGDSKTDEPE